MCASIETRPSSCPYFAAYRLRRTTVWLGRARSDLLGMPARQILETDEQHAPPVPPDALQEPVDGLSVLGEALKARAGDVLAQTVALTGGPGYEQVDGVVQGSFER